MKRFLQYIWIDKWHCIDHQGFNFSEEYSIEYDMESCTLNISKNDKYYSNDFFQKNTDLTAIVGENGTGKTTFLRTLLATSDLNLISFGFIIVYKFETELKIYYHKVQIEKVATTENHTKNKIGEFVNSSVPTDLSSNMRYIYYTGLLNKIIDPYDSIPDISDLSTYSLMKKNNKHGIDMFFLNEFTKQIEFFLSNKDRFKEFGINNPGYVTVYFNNNKAGLKELIQRYYHLYEKEDLTNEQITAKSDACIHNFLGTDETKSENTPNKLFEANLTCAMFLSIIQRLCKIGINNDECRILFDFTNCKSDDKSPFERIKKFLNDIKYPLCFPIDEYIDFIEYIEQEIMPNANFTYFSLQTLRFTMNADPEKKLSGVNVNGSLPVFVSKYEATINEDGYLYFEWGISSGEFLLFSIFARLSYEEKRRSTVANYNKPTNVLVLLDEVEVSFHPEWQRRYLRCMLNYLSDLYSDSYIQIVIATHSPIILSDIPRQNIIYLKKGLGGNIIIDSNKNHSETFGANIFRLFNDSFFLDKGAIGEFAKEKLETLLRAILNKKGNKNDLQKRIDMIGDLFLKNRFQAQLNAIYASTLDEEIAALENELKSKKKLREMQKHIENNN